jgi:hypothetical protein
MNKAKSDFLSWPKHLTRDYLGTLMMGFGLGCMFGGPVLTGLGSTAIMVIGFSVLIVGVFVRGKGGQVPTNTY